MKKFCVILFCLICGISGVSALEKNMKMGKPTNEELSLTTFDEDPDADAVCLYYSTSVQFQLTDQGIKAEYHYKVRLKILKPEGVDWGNVSISYFRSARNLAKENILAVKGTTYNLEDGKVVKTKLNGDLKSDEMMNNYYHLYKFSMPNVKVGSVLEYEYKISSDFFHQIRDWYAQKSIPVKYAEFVITVPEFLKFGKLVTGAYTIEHKVTDTQFTVMTKNGQFSCNAMNEVYWAEDLPKMVDESYIYNINDYKSHIVYDLQQIAFPGQKTTVYNNSWPDVDKMLLEDEDFGALCKMKNPMPEFGVFLKGGSIDAKKIEKAEGATIIDLDENASVMDKVGLLRSVLRSKIKWNGNYGIYGKNVRQLVKDPSVNAASLNFALMAFLRDAGIEAAPVVLSRRSQGRITSAHADINSLNATVLQVWDGDNVFYVDAANDEYPVSVLPADYLVQYARVVSPNRTEWVDISNCCKANSMYFVNATLQDDGTLSGLYLRRQRGVLSGVYRKLYNNKKDSLTFVENLASHLDCEITDYRLDGISSVSENYSDSIFFTKQVDADGESIYINPYLFVGLKSPFSSDTRELPIECDCSLSEKYSIRIKIPEGYAVESAPKPVVVRLEDGKTLCKIVTGVSPSEITVSISYTRDTMFYNASDFQTLRSFWSTIEDACNTILVLKKQ